MNVLQVHRNQQTPLFDILCTLTQSALCGRLVFGQSSGERLVKSRRLSTDVALI